VLSLDFNTILLIANGVSLLAAIYTATRWLAARLEKALETLNEHATILAVHTNKIDALEAQNPNRWT
jgi:hypothetical protein